MKQCLWSSTEDTLRLTSRREIPQVKVLILKNTIKRKKTLPHWVQFSRLINS